MIQTLSPFLAALVFGFKPRRGFAPENLDLRQQLAICQRRHPRPILRPRDRFLRVWRSKAWGHWRSALPIVKPETVLRWHHGA